MDGAPGNFYQLCWARASEPAAEDYDLEIDTDGELFGPEPVEVSAGCVAGHPRRLCQTASADLACA